MVRRFFRWVGLAVIASILLACAWLVAGLLRPLEPIPHFGEDYRSVAIVNVSIIDVVAGATLTGKTVLVENGLISNIGTADEVAIPTGTHRVDGTGKFLIPGLWDSHIHTLAHSPRLHFPLLLANGITSIRNMGDGCSWRGNLDCVPDRIDWTTQGAEAERLAPYTAVTASFHFEDIYNAADGVRLVGVLKNRGDTLIKLQLPDEVDPAVMQAIIDEARRLSMPVAGHLPASVDLGTSALGGLTSIEHGNQLLDQCERQARGLQATSIVGACLPLLQELVERRTAFVPTFVASTGQDVLLGSKRRVEDAQRRYAPAPVATIWTAYRSLHTAGMDASDYERAQRRHQMAMDLALLAHRAGVPVFVGTDALDPFVLHGVSMHDELEIFVQAGFPNAEALRAATLAPADFHGLSGQSGQIIAGARADLVLLNGNPLEHITATREIEAVFKGNVYFDRAELERLESFADGQANSHSLNARLWWALLGG